MARKPILEGGKKEELVAAALALFLERGYEAVSIRLILEQVGGEVGMFYHYFKSKQEIFDAAAKLFLQQYALSFGQALAHCDNPSELFDVIFDLLTTNIARYKQIGHKDFHWSTQMALNELTVASIVPQIASVLKNLRHNKSIRPEIACSDRELAAYILFGARAILHEKPLLELSQEELATKWTRIKEMTIYILCPKEHKEVEFTKQGG